MGSECTVENPADDGDEEDPKQPGRQVPVASTTAAASVEIRVAARTLLGQYEPVFDAAGAAKDVGVIRGAVALAHDLGAAELELGRERGAARPLYVLRAVAGALIHAAHGVDLVQRAHGPRRHALELRHGRHPAVRGLTARAEREGLDLCGCVSCQGRRGKWIVIDGGMNSRFRDIDLHQIGGWRSWALRRRLGRQGRLRPPGARRSRENQATLRKESVMYFLASQVIDSLLIGLTPSVRT